MMEECPDVRTVHSLCPSKLYVYVGIRIREVYVCMITTVSVDIEAIIMKEENNNRKRKRRLKLSPMLFLIGIFNPKKHQRFKFQKTSSVYKTLTNKTKLSVWVNTKKLFFL